MLGYYVLTCRNNCELEAVDELSALFGDGVKIACPMIVEQRKPKHRRSRKMIDVSIPRFKGYLFANFSEGEEWQRIFNSRFVWGVLSFAGQPCEVAPVAIEEFKDGEDATLNRLSLGDEIIFIDGPWTGHSGLYISDGVVEVDLFGRASVIHSPVAAFEKRCG